MSEEKSEVQYAAICSGDDHTGSWLWCSVFGKTTTKSAFHLYVVNGGYEAKYDPVGRTLKIGNQVHLNVRLAGFGKVPKEWLSETASDYNVIIERYLRSGEYHSVEYFVHDRV